MSPLRQKLDQPVTWVTFTWVCGIIFVLFSTTFTLINRAEAKADRAMDGQQAILVQLSQIQTDLRNLDARLAEIRADIKQLR